MSIHRGNWGFLSPTRSRLGDWPFLVLVAVLASTGCTRTFWRGRADREVAYLVAEKSNNPRWALPPGFNLNIDPRSRYYDPTNPDHPPLPPDDPYSHVYMHRVDGKRAAPWWHINGELPQLPNPGWRQRLAEYCEMTPEGAIKLDLPGAVALSYIHQPQNRTQLEQLYLSALDVSAERFRFNLQFYPGASLAYLTAGKIAGGGAPKSTLTETNGVAPGAPSGAVLQKEFVTGGTLLVNFANSFVWQLAGPQSNNANTLINLNLVQPLLAGGGRIITLETLTIAERTLLANLRWYERWRQSWFTTVATGQTSPQGILATNSVTRRGGGFGGTGITGFSGNGVGGLGNVASSSGFVGFGGAGNVAAAGGQATQAIAGAAGGGAGNLQGFYGILQLQVNIDNAQNALNLQIRTLRLLESYLEAGLINIAQVHTFRQSVETGKANLLLARIQLEGLKDTFRQAILGLPPDLPMVFDDPLIKQFQLIDPRFNDLQSKLVEFIERAGALPATLSPEQLSGLSDDLSRLFTDTGSTLPRIREDLRVLESRTEERTRGMTPAAREEFLNAKQRLNDKATDLETLFTQMEVQLENWQAEFGQQDTNDTINSAVALSNGLATVAQEAALITASARLESIVIPIIELSTIDALQIARAHRLDWMNLRASLVDQWRLICFNANSLRSILNLTVNGSLGTVGNNPAKFEANNGQLSLGVQFAPPFTRLLQRNNYRQALVQYQQFRRTVIQFEDTTNITLRNDMRQIVYFQVNFEIQREAVRIAIQRVDDTREELNQPPPRVNPGQTATLGPTAASNLLSALQALSDSQNNLMSNWLQHYQQRMFLYDDLGIMRLDNRGMWIDEPIDQGLAQLEQMYPLPPELPVDWLKDAGLEPPAVLPTEGVPPLGGTMTQVQAEAATPETPRPRMDLPRPEERQPSRDIESLPMPEEAPAAPVPVQDATDEAARGKTDKPKRNGWSWPFKKPGTAEDRKPSKAPAAAVSFRDAGER